MNTVPLTLERCKDLFKKGLYFKKSCPGLTAGWLYYKIKALDENRKTITIEPMDNSFCPNWNPLGRVKYRIEDVSEMRKETKRRNGRNKEPKPEPDTKERKRRASPSKKEEPKKKKRRRNT